MANNYFGPSKNHSFTEIAALGEASGHQTVNVFGTSTVVDGVSIPAWELGTAYTYPTGGVVTVASSAAGDNGVQLFYEAIDSDWEIFTGVVTLDGADGTTPVNVPLAPNGSNLVRINHVWVIGTKNPTGIITVTENANTVARINAGVGKTQMSVYSVAANHIFMLYRIGVWSATATSSSQYLTFTNWTRDPITGITRSLAQTTFVENLTVERVFPLAYRGPVDIQFRVQSSQGTQQAGVFVEGVLMENHAPPYFLPYQFGVAASHP